MISSAPVDGVSLEVGRASEDESVEESLEMSVEESLDESLEDSAEGSELQESAEGISIESSSTTSDSRRNKIGVTDGA